MSLQDLGLTYEQALHGIQTAIKYVMENVDSKFVQPKHLRVGIDSAHVTDLAITSLLIKKGIITKEEYIEEVRLAMNHELAQWEQQCAPLKFR